MSPAQQIAVTQARRVAAALVRLGGPADVGAIAAECALPDGVVVRRLMNSSKAWGPWPALFRREARGVWSVTEAGRRAAKE